MKDVEAIKNIFIHLFRMNSILNTLIMLKITKKIIIAHMKN